MSVLFVDNVDSFTYNVVHLLAAHHDEISVIASHDERLTPALLDCHAALVVGPGPGRPGAYPRVARVLEGAFERRTPVLGICLGLQAVAEAFGGRVTHAPRVMHGKISSIRHVGAGLFVGVPNPFSAIRYHSLCAQRASLPACLQVTAVSEDGVVQGLAHADLPVHAVQFHPESVLSRHGPTIARNFLAIAGLVDTRARA